MKIYSIMTTLLVATLLAGCSGQIKKLPNGDYLSATTAGDSPDRSATYVQILEKVGDNPDGTPIFKQKAGDLTVGSTVVGDTIKGTVPIAVGGLIQRDAAIRSSKIKARALTCPDGTSNCHSTVIGVTGGTAVSGASAASQTDVDFNAAIQTGGCPSGNCVAIPMD